MKMFKRFAAALLAGVMVLAMLTACGGGLSTPTSDVEKAESLYMDAFNTALGTNYENNNTKDTPCGCARRTGWPERPQG